MMTTTTVAKSIKAHADGALRRAQYDAYAALTSMAVGLAIDEFGGSTDKALAWLNKKCGLDVTRERYSGTLRVCGIAEVRWPGYTPKAQAYEERTRREVR